MDSRSKLELKCQGSMLKHVSAEFVQDGIQAADVEDILIPALRASSWQLLDLSENSLGPVGACSLAANLSRMNLRELRLAYNGLGDCGGIAIAKVLPSTCIERLILEGNNVSDHAAYELSLALECSHLEELYLSHNRITDSGALALFEKISRLKILDLYHNAISDTAITKLANSIPQHMAELYIGENRQVTDASVVPLAKALETTSIQLIGLMKNSISDCGVRALIQAAKRSISLAEVLIEGNPCSTQLNQELDNILVLKDTNWFKLVIALCSVRDIRRLGARSHLRLLPVELLRKIAITLGNDGT